MSLYQNFFFKLAVMGAILGSIKYLFVWLMGINKLSFYINNFIFVSRQFLIFEGENRSRPKYIPLVITLRTSFAGLHGASDNWFLAHFGIFWHFLANVFVHFCPLTICDKSKIVILNSRKALMRQYVTPILIILLSNLVQGHLITCNPHTNIRVAS